MIPDYLGGAAWERIRIGSNVYVKVYNDLGSTIARGSIYGIDLLDDADSQNLYPTPLIAATQATVNFQLFGVALGDILDTELGFFQIEGDCPAVLAEGTISDEQTIEVLNADFKATADGAAITGQSIGVAKGAATAGTLFRAALLGRQVLVQAT